MTEEQTCEGLDCAWCTNLECPNERKTKMTDEEQIIEGVKLKATVKSVKRYMRDGCNYSLYCDCNKCKNESWYDDDYCNNERLHFIDNNTKTIRVYCENYEVNNDK